MRGKRVKKLRKEAKLLGVTMSKLGFRRLKKAHTADRKADAKQMIMNLVMADVARSRRAR